MKYPPNHQSTSTKQPLKQGPADMPDRGGPKVNVQTTSSQVKMSRTANPVAAFGAKPGMGEVQCNSSKAGLSRTATSPYGPLGATSPQVSFGGKKKK